MQKRLIYGRNTKISNPLYRGSFGVLAFTKWKVQDKIVYNINKCRFYTDNELFKKLENSEIWEFRTLYNKTSYRLFAFWDNDEQTFVVATHGIIKKTQKTPSKEIARAEAIRKEYFNNKWYGKMKLYTHDEMMDSVIGEKVRQDVISWKLIWKLI